MPRASYKHTLSCWFNMNNLNQYLLHFLLLRLHCCMAPQQAGSDSLHPSATLQVFLSAVLLYPLSCARPAETHTQWRMPPDAGQPIQVIIDTAVAIADYVPQAQWHIQHSLPYAIVTQIFTSCRSCAVRPFMREACLAARLLLQTTMQEPLQSNQEALLDTQGPSGYVHTLQDFFTHDYCLQRPPTVYLRCYTSAHKSCSKPWLRQTHSHCAPRHLITLFSLSCNIVDRPKCITCAFPLTYA